MPIVQGAITTLLGMSGLINAPSESYDIFFQVTVDVIVLGLYHGLLVLPVFLLISEDIARFLWGCVDCIKSSCGCSSPKKDEEQGGEDSRNNLGEESGVTFTLTSLDAPRRGQNNTAFMAEDAETNERNSVNL